MITSSDSPSFAISMTSWLVNRLRNVAPSWPPAKQTATNKMNRLAIALRWAALIADRLQSSFRPAVQARAAGLYPRLRTGSRKCAFDVLATYYSLGRKHRD